MPLYRWKSERTGERRDEWAPMAKAPELGERRDFDGETYVRVIEPPGAIVKDYAHTAYSLPKARTEAERIRRGYPRVNDRGQPVFQSRKEILEFEASNPDYKWDRGHTSD